MFNQLIMDAPHVGARRIRCSSHFITLFLKSIGCPTRFSDLGIGDELLETYARETLRIVNDGNGKLSARPAMTEADIVTVLRAAL